MTGDVIADVKRRAVAFAEGLFRSAGLDVQVQVVREEPEGVLIGLSGSDARHFIGKAGQGLDALQYLTTLAVTRRMGNLRYHITYDADDYRARREATLIKMAQELADQVEATGQEAVLDPMSPLERRIVHQALLERPAVRTYSEGEEPERYLVIAPALEP